MHPWRYGAAQAIGDVSVLAISSRRFHAVIAEAGGPAFIAAHLPWIWETYPVPTADSVWQVDEVAGRGIAEHGALLDVLERGDADSAERIMTEHIAHTRLDRHAQRAALLDAPPHTRCLHHLAVTAAHRGVRLDHPYGIQRAQVSARPGPARLP
jgi:hypothetical protein